MEILVLEEAAHFLNLSKDIVKDKAVAGEIYGRKIGKDWVFVKANLAEWLTGAPPKLSPPKLSPLWQEAFAKWEEVKSTKKSMSTDHHHFNILKDYLFDLPISEINDVIILKFIEDRRVQGVKNTTINRSLALLKAILRMSLKQKWINKAPYVPILRNA